MPRYIDAEKAEEILRTWDMQDLYLPIHFKDFILDETPTADVQEVKHGHWENEKHTFSIGDMTATGTYPTCDICGAFMTGIQNMHYCPNCGARMDS